MIEQRDFKGSGECLLRCGAISWIYGRFDRDDECKRRGALSPLLAADNS